jgi:hypothetical protein
MKYLIPFVASVAAFVATKLSIKLIIGSIYFFAAALPWIAAAVVGMLVYNHYKSA